MNEHDNVKESLKELLELSEAKEITTNGKPTTVEEFQDLVKESVCNIADLLGVEDIYLSR